TSDMTGMASVNAYRFLFKLLFILNFIAFTAMAENEDNTYSGDAYFHWKTMAQLPPPAGHQNQPGLAGAFSGIHNGALIIAGGANFPGAMPWDGGKKVWWDHVYVLEKQGAETKWVSQGQFKLVTPAAYGISIATSHGLLCIGGDNEQGPVEEISLLSWDPVGKKISSRKLGDLPGDFLTTGGFLVGEVLYVAGIAGDSNRLLGIRSEERRVGKECRG